ncbi:MAG: repeat-containing protein [Proteobacteria bacterium]|nr:repeat-containing protein [Pseudomonadota bacterium]
MGSPNRQARAGESLAINDALDRATSLMHQGDMLQAAYVCQAALASASRHPQAAYLYGRILCNIGDAAEGKPWLKIAVAAMPKNAGVITDWATCLLACGEINGAEKNYRKALEIDPAISSAWRNLADIHSARGDFNKASHAIEKYLSHQPEDAPAWAKLCALHVRLNQFGTALAAAKKALEIDPQCHAALFNLSWAHFLIGQTQEGLEAFDKTKAADRSLYDWQTFLFQANAIQDIAPEALAEYHRDFSARLDDKFAEYRPQHRNTAIADRPIRVGFISGDLRNHPVGYFLTALFQHLDKENFSLFAYSNHAIFDKTSEKIKQHCRQWRSIATLNDSAVHQLVLDDEIDILLDLSGHSTDNRLAVFAAKAAPVQATYLGYFATTGLHSMDYILCNKDLIPASERGLYTETPWYLPDAHVCYTPHDKSPAPCRIPQDDRKITFGSLQRMSKINRSVLEAWAEILEALPDSNLLIMNREVEDPFVASALQAFFTSRGIDPARIALKGAMNHTDYLAMHQQIDIVLDTFPYNGTTTTMDALWMGVPVLTLAGDRYCAHMAEAVLNQAGLQDWVARDRGDYVRLAVDHASNPEYLTRQRGGMRERLLNSPLLDAPLFARNFGDALRGMWRKWCEEQPNQHDSTH